MKGENYKGANLCSPLIFFKSGTFEQKMIL